MGSLGFMVGYTTFLLLFIQFMGFLGEDLNQQSQYNNVITGMSTPMRNTTAPTGIISATTSFFDNILFFFSLMSVDSGFWWIGAFVLTPFVIGVVWSVLELISNAL